LKIIAEKINGTRKRVAQAIQERDAAFIQNLAQQQAAVSQTAWLDANAGTAPQREPEDLIWLVETIQSVVDKPIALDSANVKALEAAIKVVKNKPMINSISLEPSRMAVFPIVAEYKCPAVALAMDEKGIPKTKEERIDIIGRILEKTRPMGIPDEDLYFDPLAMTIGTGPRDPEKLSESTHHLRIEQHLIRNARAHLHQQGVSRPFDAGWDGLRHLRSEQSGHPDNHSGHRAAAVAGQALPQFYARIPRRSF
jgi:cobalamin-dependent methionine synthase I